MESTLPLSFVLWLVGFLVTLLGGCWAIFKYFEAKLNSVYRRLDENKEQFYHDFVTQKAYDAEMKARKESIDDRFSGIVLLFTEKIDGVKTDISRVLNRIEKMDKN